MSNWDPKANDIFLQAIEITGSEDRGRFLDAACAADVALRARVEGLIRSHKQAGEFLGRPILEPTGGPGPGGDETRTAPSSTGDVSLDFLAPSDEPGSLGRLGHYEVQAVIGRGGMGVVLKAFDENLHRVVAIKVMAPQLATAATARARFTREARAQAAIAHEHVVTIHAVAEAGGLPYIVMQYVAGLSLQDRLDRDGPLRLNEVLRIGVQAAAGLAASHKQGLVHRDIKPANILLENGVERVKLTDFGLARAADDASLTASGQVAGTPQYMSPEQAEGKPIDARSDLFSLGSVLYAMCAGRPPFRAASTLAVLKRVCEDTPTPVREVNPEVPDWLADAIAKLHAKNPAERFQSADEVADMLGGLLARVQRPSGAVDKPTATPARRRPRWVGAAAVLALLAAGLVAAEATGVTRLRAVVARVFTPADPSVVEGGPVEPVRPADVPVVSSGAFVILARGGRPEQKLDTLAEAIRLAQSADTIEVRGNGPFLQERIRITNAVRIRAGEGFRPVFQVSLLEHGSLLETSFPIVLEGLDFQALIPDSKQQIQRGSILESQWGPVYLSNCRFVSRLGDNYHSAAPSVRTYAASRYEVYNCQFVADTAGLELDVNNAGIATRIVLRNNLIVTRNHPLFLRERSLATTFDLQLTRNTLMGGGMPVLVASDLSPSAPLDEGGGAAKSVRIKASGNVFVGRMAVFGLSFMNRNERPVKQTERPTVEWVRRQVSWKGDNNLLFAADGPLFQFSPDPKEPPLVNGATRLDGWRQFWDSPETGSMEGRPRFVGGEILFFPGKGGFSMVAPEHITPEVLRLHGESLGRAAGPDGEDLGADMDFVGPGAAYEKWKKTPAYQKWQKDTEQALAMVPQLTDRPFVILGGGNGAASRTFPALAEAVQAAAHGDTIEVRGDGPFVSAAIPPIKGRRLTIRAAAGASPVLRWNGDGGSKISPSQPAFLSTDADLAVEGLEFQAVSSLPATLIGNLIQVTNGGTVWVANCRFRSPLLPNGAGNPTLSGIRPWEACCVVRNSSFLGAWSGAAVFTMMAGRAPLGRETLAAENCVFATPDTNHPCLSVGSFNQSGPSSLILLTDNTFAGGTIRVHWGVSLLKLAEKPEVKLFGFETSGNVFALPWLFNISASPDPVTVREAQQIQKPADAEPVLRSLISWREKANMHADGTAFYNVLGKNNQRYTSGMKLKEWADYFGAPAVDSLQGRVRLRGGDLAARLRGVPDALTEVDFRLADDSAGKGARKDGKDLGADIDLVGPGAAYEKWKTTPAYQQWLKDSGQKK